MSRFIQITKSTLGLKCPRCHQGKVLSSHPYNPKKIGNTRSHCDSCGLKYSREPGFFFGAAYVSYAITVAFGAAVVALGYIIQRFIFPELSWYQILAAVIIGLLLFFPLAYALSRVLWLNFFVPFNPKLKGE